jgi:hypothetical protein
MKEEPISVQLEPTKQQQERIRPAAGKPTDTLEFSITELEERIAPRRLK